jgi:hypothetical protein
MGAIFFVKKKPLDGGEIAGGIGASEEVSNRAAA